MFPAQVFNRLLSELSIEHLLLGILAKVSLVVCDPFLMSLERLVIVAVDRAWESRGQTTDIDGIWRVLFPGAATPNSRFPVV